MSAWIKSLPEVDDYSPRTRAGFAIMGIGSALSHMEGHHQLKDAIILAETQQAAAHVRAWRKSLPKDQQDEHYPEDALEVFRDVRTDLLDALLGIYHASLYANVGHNLREAEAFLRRAGEHMMGESDE